MGWETKTTWGDLLESGVNRDTDATEYTQGEAPPPEGDGWEPFAGGFASPGRSEDRFGRTRHEDDAVQFIIWRRLKP